MKSFVISFTENTPVLDENYQAVLVYLFDRESGLAIPYYHFYEENDILTQIHLNGWFVPAIKEEYITNMPDSGKVVN